MTILGTSWLNHVQIRVLCDHISVEPSVSTMGTVRYLRILRQTIGDMENNRLALWNSHRSFMVDIFSVIQPIRLSHLFSGRRNADAAKILTSFHFMISLMCRYSK